MAAPINERINHKVYSARTKFPTVVRGARSIHVVALVRMRQKRKQHTSLSRPIQTLFLGKACGDIRMINLGQVLSVVA